MGPVAAAAKSHGMIYGLWFEFERVVSGTQIHREHPEWLLHSTDGREGQYLLNLGLPAVREHLFQIVKGFMDLPGFRVYRQDFNMDPLPYWLHSDAPDRQGITEMKYVAGLYEYWDRIANTWPNSLREECASGGRRIDLETIIRMHIHQKSDYWFDNEVDQASIWGLSQYLPNSTIMAPLNRLDDYSFHSALATSLCLGWIADAPDFDLKRAQELADRYRRVRHLLIGGWYPLLPYTRDPQHWMAAQYHRPDLGEGMALVFRHAESPYPAVELQLHGLDPAATYDLEFQTTGQKARATGAELMTRWRAVIEERGKSELIVYRKRA
jgi:alpha-galactosidase